MEEDSDSDVASVEDCSEDELYIVRVNEMKRKLQKTKKKAKEDVPNNDEVNMEYVPNEDDNGDDIEDLEPQNTIKGEGDGYDTDYANSDHAFDSPDESEEDEEKPKKKNLSFLCFLAK
ncbi:hypothetical protein FRX31_008429 [Thalictrum thalictroides]|uniref:Uncharacterized protein n=1 Tax=Thalictrum thalictroides TaxID=46969 RepID=A0A7J6WZH5_THATH|nr:hypothetical protein FRX31_008429 [Thalictrum thalictroides]